MRPTRTVAIVAGALLALSGCGASDDQSGDDTSLTLGFIAPTTGPYATYGTEMKKSFDLYLKMHDNKLGGSDVKAVSIDEGAGGSEAVAGAQRMIRQEQVDLATGVASSGTAVALAPVFDSADVPLILSVGGADALLDSPSDAIWKVAGQTALQPAYALGRWTAENEPDKRVFSIQPDYTGGREILQSYNAGSRDGGGDGVVGDRFYPLGSTTDFQPYLEALNKSGADELFSMPAGGAGPFLQQFRQFTDGISYRTMGGIYSPTVLAEANDEAVGIEDSYYYSWTLDNPANKEFVEAFEAEYGTKPAGEAAGQWEAMIVLDQALAAVDGDINAKTVAKAIKSLGEITTPAGTFTLDPDHHLPVRNVKLFRVETLPDGTLAEVENQDLGKVGYVELER